ncbi:hypothetical protein [Actibacterium sp. MT2.3-13A]|uniref:hypothetical protein n=1 Tax=Actibacterium sp. MT2.3-13A TaxID=2828332 RepID=UPI001BA7FB90|nr:hypothetical protein [Actibacterium sp. MT2.3-13A]
MALRVLSDSAGRTVVRVGHKGSLTGVPETLAAPGQTPLDDGDLVFVEAGRRRAPKVMRKRFGTELDE